MTHYDLVIVGAGSGNSIVDDRFDHLQVAIIDRGPFGGTCLNRGCIPSKMFVHPADVAADALQGPDLGVRTSYDGADWPAIRDRIFGRVDHAAEAGRQEKQEADNITVLVGTCRFTGERELVVDLADGGAETVTADQVVVAAGSHPVVPDIDGLHDVEHHTSDTVMRLEALPRRLGVIGGGYVGSELANVFATYGSEVTQADSAPVLLSNQDLEVARVFTDEVSRRWDVRVETELTRVERTPDGAALLHLSDDTTVEVDVVLVAVGRTPSSAGLDLDRAGIDVDDRGLVVVDEHQRTTAEGVWALGDISSPEPLKHVANQDARVVQANLLLAFGIGPHGGRGALAVSDHRFVPQAVFARPQVASVGLTEDEARDRGIDLAVGRHAFGDVAHGWALLEDETDHRVKLLADRSTGRLVGAHLIGPQASVLVQPLILAMSHGLEVRGLARSMYWIHPALTEVVENALLALEDDLGDA